MTRSTLDVATVREAARGHWRSILAQLSINVPNDPKKHSPCPICGGKDRFRFDDRDGHGSWFCNQCEPHAGDGFKLVMNSKVLAFPEALTTVGSVLGLEHTRGTKPHRPLPPPPVRIDWRARAFACELSALDRRLRAARVLAAIPALDDTVSDAVRDRLMAVVCSAYDDLAQAERLDYLADVLRVKDFERGNRPS